MKTKRRFESIGTVTEILILIIIVSVLSFILNLLGASGYKTEAGTFETTLITVNNIFSIEGIKHILNNTFSNFQSINPLIALILSLISISILDASGLLKHVFTPLKGLKSKTLTMIIVFVGIISTIIGDNSYVLLLPLSGLLYKYIGKSPTLGILSMFISITIGYGTGLIYNYQIYQLGNLTEIAASSISANYNYELLSNIFFLIASVIILTIVGSIVLDTFGKKFKRVEITDNLNISKKAARSTLFCFIIIMALIAYCIIPGLPMSGLLLNKAEPTYVGKLLSNNSPFTKGFMFIIVGISMICGYIYGKVSRNIKNSKDYSNALSKSFDNIGYVFVLIFFISILYEIIDWTNLATVISTNVVDFIGASKLSGLLLILFSFISIVLISIIVPGSLEKWQVISPIYVPLLMRANISPAFTQTLFLAADSVGKLFSPVYIYLLITIGFIYKYEKDFDASIVKIIKKVMPIILILSVSWLIIVLGWYLIGLPIGINSAITL